MDTIDPRLDRIIDCLYRVAAKAVIVKDSKLLMTKELDDEWWNLPGGGIDHGEAIEQALGRELSEELGLDPADVRYGSRALFVTIGAVVRGIPKMNLFYKAYAPAEKIRPTDHIITYAWYGADEIQQLYLSPSLKDGVEQLVAALTVSAGQPQ